MKPFFETPQVQLYQGDCLEVMPQLPDRSIDAIICDLPYGTTACSWDSVIPFEPLWEQYKRLIKPNGAIVLFGSQPFTTDLINSNRLWFKYCWVWDKVSNSSGLAAKYRPLQCHEDVVVFSKGSTVYNPQMTSGVRWHRGGSPNRVGSNVAVISKKGAAGKDDASDQKLPKTIIQFSNANQTGKFHPTQKPLELLKYLAKTYTSPGDRILDNTAGSFTTGVAAVNTGRQFIGIEREKKYCQIGQKRISEAIQEIESMLIKPWEIDAPQVQGDQLNLLEVS